MILSDRIIGPNCGSPGCFYFRAAGCVDALIAKASVMVECWLKGFGTAQRLVRQPG